MLPIPNAELICISNFPHATYSGMLPGVLAGQYPVEAMEIDLVRLATSAGARIILDQVVGVDIENQQVLFQHRPALDFDVLSIGIGSRPDMEGVQVRSDTLLAIKPMQTFLKRLREAVDKLRGQSQLDVAIVGGGVGSIEIALCLAARLKREPKFLNNESTLRIRLVTASDRPGNGLREATIRRVEKALEQAEIEVVAGSRVSVVESDHLVLENGKSVPANLVLWATGATAPELLKKIPLEHDQRGFLLTRDTLQTTQHDRIFAVGDSGTLVNHRLPKAGVYAVRQGPVLWDNIQRMLTRHQLIEYHPQRDFLKLINLGDGRAIAEYRGFSSTSSFWWKLKNRIDVKFMRMYQDYEPMMHMPVPDLDEHAMRCLGCGGKVGGEILSSVLRELQVPTHPDVITGLDQPDDAAVIRVPDGQVTVTTDFFAAPLDDPYLVGRIATLNSVSDCYVMGARPTTALAIVELPVGHPRGQLRVMRELMAGATEELARASAGLVGGHTIEGPRLTVGFTVLGQQVVPPLTKDRLQPGDRLVLSKPLGTGALLAAWMQCKLDGNHVPDLVDCMLQSNAVALELVQRFEVTSMTDVTGFGLAGHLIEMLTASGKGAQLSLDSIPCLPGFDEVVKQGIESTLAPDNRTLAHRIEWEGVDFESPRSAKLFDPQTSGGLLVAVPASAVDDVVRFLRDSGFPFAGEIGFVTSGEQGVRVAIA